MEILNSKHISLNELHVRFFFCIIVLFDVTPESGGIAVSTKDVVKRISGSCHLRHWH